MLRAKTVKMMTNTHRGARYHSILFLRKRFKLNTAHRTVTMLRYVHLSSHCYEYCLWLWTIYTICNYVPVDYLPWYM